MKDGTVKKGRKTWKYSNHYKKLKETENSYKSQADYYKNFLRQKGFSFDADGNADPSRLKSLVNSADYEAIKEVYDLYVELQRDTIPDLQKEWYDLEGEQKDLKDSINDINEELKEQAKELKEFEKIKAFDFLDELTDKQEKLSKQMDLLEAKMEITYGSKNKERMLNEQITLIDRQMDTLIRVNEELEKQQKYLQKNMKSDGFKFDKNGNISNLESVLNKAKTKEEYDELKEKAEEYQDIQNQIIDGDTEWYEYQKQVEEAKNEIEQLKEEMKELKEEAKLTELTNEVTKLSNEFERLENLQGMAGQDTLDLLNKQLDLIEEQKIATSQLLLFRISQANQMQSELSSYGFKFDEDGLVTNADKVLERLKNTLSDDEFGEPDKDFAFYYNITIDENTGMPIDGTDNSNWKEINLTNEDLLIWKPESLTFTIKDDIMYLDEEKPNIPVSSVYFKVTKTGKKRKVDENTLEVKIGSDGKPEMEEEPIIYSSIVQFFAENHGVGKYITPMEPQSYTFLEDQNNEIFYWEHPTQDFFVRLDGFTTEEEINDVLENAYWRIEGEETQYKHYLVGMNEQADKELDDSNSSAIYLDVDEEEVVIINGTEVDGGDTLNANKEKNTSDEVESDQDKLTVRLQKNDDGTLYAIATIGYDKVPEGGNVAITFCLHSATRTAYCFRQRNGQDSINIVMRSSSGSTLTTGDLSTTLSADLYYGMRLANEGEEEQKYFYVWKENGVALSSFKRRIVVETTNESTAEITKQETFNEFSVQNGVPSAGFFKQKSIYITAADFGLKSDYRCDIFTDEQSAKDEYLLNNKNGDEVLY